LGSFKEKTMKGEKENVTQIMWPSIFIDNLLNSPLHRRTLFISKVLEGEDIEMDFDMLIYKAPFSNTEFPWHQDEGYWRKTNILDFTNENDLRGTNFWTALDDCTVENGCMWYCPGSHLLGYFKHEEIKKGHHTI